MAIRIPILTQFDPKGLRQANASFAKLSGSVSSLGRNFAVAGAAIAAAGAVIAKNVQSLARIERINAQTAQTITSMGNASNISAKEVESLAGSLEALTATEAETIQEGANLLLTFRNIANQAGAGNDIFNQTTAIMVDMGRALNEGAAASAIRLGKALNDPIRGITALRKVGVGFTKDQEAQIKALQESGDLMGAQKVILAELQAQFGGSGAAYAKTFSGQLELMGHELGTIGEEATMSVMPALQGMVEQLRELIPVIGPQLKAAIESVDFVALGQAVVGFTSFLINNAQTIANLVVGIFALNTAFKLMAVVSGIAGVAIQLKTWYMAQLTSGMTAASIATGVFSSALKLIPFVAITTAVIALGTEIANLGSKFDQYKTSLDKSNTGMSDFAVEATAATFAGQDLLTMFSPLNKIVNDLALGILNLILQLKNIPKDVSTTITIKEIRQTAGQVASSFGGNAFDAADAAFQASRIATAPKTISGGGGGSAPSALGQLIADSKKNATIVKKQSTLERKGLSKEVAQWVTTSNKPVKAANQAIQRLTKNGNKAVANLTKAYTKSAAGQAAAAAASASSATESFSAVYDDTADKEAAALAERERVYQSFADSVKNTFAGIKNSILNAFDLTELGGSTNAITRNMDKLLVRLRAFATNVSKLSGMGLNPALLQQVISAGPLAGARLAETLAMGGAGALAAINAGYSEFGTLSSQIAQTGTESLFNREAQQSVYNISVDGGVGSGATIGKAIVDAIKAYERTSGAVWQGA
jgi:hypothetical protein